MVKIDLLEIQKNISNKDAIGSDISQFSEFEWLDTELMKVGSLAHESIEWDKVVALSWKILTEESKDFRVLSFLIQGLQQKGDVESFVLSMQLLKLFLENYWLAYPYINETPRINRNRNRFLAQILKRATQKVEDLQVEKSSANVHELLMNALQEIKCIFQDRQLPLDELEVLISSSQQIDIIPVEKSPLIQESNRQPVSGSVDNTVVLNDATTLLQFLKSEKDEKFVNRLIGQLERNEEFLLATIMRRIMLWDGIKEIPMHSGDGETTLSAPSQEIISRSNLLLTTENVSLEDWQQLENSLMKAPFWLDAHHISASIATRLFSASFEIEIKQRVKEFLEKLPQLKTLTFSNGMSYISEATLEWLQEDNIQRLSEVEDDSVPSQGGEFYQLHLWNSYLLQTNQYYEVEGLMSTLHYLHDKIRQAENIREKTLWQLAISQIYIREGLHELSQHNNQLILTQIKGTSLNEWEPQIFELLQNNIL